MNKVGIRLFSALAAGGLLVGLMPATLASAAKADVCTGSRVGGGIVQVTTGSPVTTLDPVNATGTVAPVRAGMPSFAMFDSLVLVDLKNKVTLRGPAQSLTANATNTEWTLKLKTGFKFGNGDPVNAAAVKASIERHVEPGLPSSLRTIYTANIASVTAPNDTSVVFALKQPWTKFPEQFLAQDAGKVMNVALIKAKGVNDFALGKVPGAGIGAYEIVSWTPGEAVTLKAKSDWWGGKLCIQDLKFVTLGNDDTTLAGVSNGQVQGGFVSDPNVLLQGQAKKLQTIAAPIYGAPGLLINMRPGNPGADLRVRQALQLAIDSKQIAQRVFPGVTDTKIVEPGKTYIPKSDPQFNKNIKIPETDAAKAKKLLDTVKAEGKFDGKLEMLASTAAPYNLEAQAVQAQLNVVGFNVTVTLTTEVVTKTDIQHNFQIVLAVIGGSPGVYQAALQNFTSTNVNVSGYTNASYETAVAGINASPNDQVFTKTLTELVNDITTDIPWVPLFSVARGTFVANNIRGVYAGRGALLIFDKAYVKAAK